MKRFLWILFALALAVPLQAQSVPQCQAGICVAQWPSITTASNRIQIPIGGTGTTSQAVVLTATSSSDASGLSVAVSSTTDGLNWTVQGTLTASGDVTFTGAFVAVAITPTTIPSGTTVTAVWTGAYPVEAGGGGGGAVSSVTGTAGEVTAAPTTGNVVVSIPSPLVAPGCVDFVGSTSSYPSACEDATYGTQLDFKLADGSAYTRIRWGKSVQTVSSSSGITLNTDEYDGITMTNTATTGTLTINAPSPSTPNDGDQEWIRIKSTNVQTYSWNSIYQGSTTQALPTTSSGSLLWDYILFQYNAVTSKWDMLAYNAGFSQ